MVITATGSIKSDRILILSLILQLPSEMIGRSAVPGLCDDLRCRVEVALEAGDPHERQIVLGFGVVLLGLVVSIQVIKKEIERDINYIVLLCIY